uniref:RNA helicase n=1 Tax=Bartheletia paradoxa TaxID=669517 RepID=A0A2D0XHY0_9BASI|nr:hypothetical protein SPAR01464 [Bartheletia paradoxa]
MAGPLSITDLVAKQKAEKEAASKPKFLTKKEREAIALERRAAEIEAKKGVDERIKKEREEFDRKAMDEGMASQSFQQGQYGRYDDRSRGGYGGGGGGYGRSSYNDPRGYNRGGGPPVGAPTGPRGHQTSGGGYTNGHQGYQNSRSSYQNNGNVPNGRQAPDGRDYISTGPTSMGPPTGPSSASSSASPAPLAAAAIPQAEMLQIKDRYLGTDKKKRKVRKMSDKKFEFDWDGGEDTSDTVNPIYSTAISIPLFGRGQIAGIDAKAQARSGTAADAAKSDAHLDHLERKRAARTGFDDRHWSEKALSEMKERDWRIFREDFSIAARGGLIPLPLRNWSESKIPKPIMDVINEIGYTEPSPIQRQAIPIGLQNRDLIGIAETGSGKTAAFVIPMLAFIQNLPRFDDENRHMGPYALILAPTRELAQQIETETRRFAKPLGYTCVSIVGGHAVEEQSYNMREGAEIIIATPGRLRDCIERHIIVLAQCTYVVMDEADRMVNLGFEETVNFILDALPVSNIKPEGEEIDEKAIVPQDGSGEEKTDMYRQTVINRLLEIFRSGEFQPPMIVFVNQKKACDVLAKDVIRAGFNATTLHSGKSQDQREESLAMLRSGGADILVATDLAGRGIDVPDVGLVVNFAMSSTIEPWVHRIGRTGRAGKKGVAITFIHPDADAEVMYDLKQEVQKSKISTLSRELDRHPNAQTRVKRGEKRERENDD